MIEEESSWYRRKVHQERVVLAKSYIDSIDIALAVKHGANFALSQIQHANRWRKVSEELPEKGIQVLVRNKYGVCHVAHLLINGWDYVFEFPPVEWKPIK